MQPLATLHLQLRLEGKEIVNECFIREVEMIPGEDLPLLLIAQLANGTIVVYYDEAISPDLQGALAGNIVNAKFATTDPLLDVLKQPNLPFEVSHYKTYVFTSMPLSDRDVHCFSKDHKIVKAFRFNGFAGQVYAIEREGNVVSACVSARENETCGEAWVYTAPDFRHQGLAQKVVNTWAGSLMRAGKLPLYSHKIENVASANLARTLGLQAVFEEISITRA